MLRYCLDEKGREGIDGAGGTPGYISCPLRREQTPTPSFASFARIIPLM